MGTLTPAEEKFLKADELLCYEDYVEAYKVLNEILDEDPTYGRAHYALGWISYRKVKDYAKAEDHLRLAVKFDPNLIEAYMEYIDLINYLNRPEVLADVIVKASKVPGADQSQLFNELAISCEKNGWLEEAIANYKRATAHCMNNEGIQFFNSCVERVKGKIKNKPAQK